MAGGPARLVFRLDDAATGEPVADLQPYLGAPAHVVIIGADGRSFAHAHGEAAGGSEAAHASGDGHAAGGASGPEIAFTYEFPAPGLYKVWGQFKDHHDEVITADFVVRVR
jgi:Cu+-exporting ATPase